MEMTTARRTGWTLALVSAALFMVTLDNLVVTTALPSIHHDLGGGIDSLEWTVNAYPLSFAAALARSIGALIGARAVQGAGGALVTPLTLTLLSEAFPAGRRGVALGIWSGISGLGVALGPVVGGAVVDGLSWHWIFWLNVPVGLAVIPLARMQLAESFGPAGRVDLPGLLLASSGLFGVVFGLVRANALGWTGGIGLTSLLGGAVLLAAFLAWETRAASPMLPLRFFRSRAFSATNAVSLAMYFGMFGSIFLLAQFFQIVQRYSPLQAGLRTLPWTGMPMIVAPIAGVLSERLGSRPLMFVGLALQAVGLGWLVAVLSPAAPYTSFIGPFVLAGAGMAMVFAPAANAVLSSVRGTEAGQASGATNAIRELGGVLGIAVLASVFTATGGYATPALFVAGLRPAVIVGAAVLAAGALAALLVPGLSRRGAAGEVDSALPGSVATAA